MNAEFVDEKCAPYTAEYKGKACGRYKDCQSIGRVKNGNFIDMELKKN